MSTPSIDEISTALFALDYTEEEVVGRQASRYGPRTYEQTDERRAVTLTAWRMDAEMLDRIAESRMALRGMIR